MDPYKPNMSQMPFYLSEPTRTRFASGPAQPSTLSRQLDAIRNTLIDELASDELPEKEKHGSLEHFLGGKYDINEMVKDVELAQRTLDNSKDDCGLRNTVKKMSSCYLSKMLEPLDAGQMKAFKLLENPDDSTIFPPKVKAEVDLLYGTKKRPRQQVDKEERKKQREIRKMEKKKKSLARRKTLLTTSTGTESSQESCPPLAPPAHQEKTLVAVPATVPNTVPPAAIPGNSGTVCSASTWNQAAKSTIASSSKKSVCLALKGVRGLALAGGVGNANASKRGRSGVARRRRGGGSRARRGRPRKTPAVATPVLQLSQEEPAPENVRNGPDTPPPSISPVLPFVVDPEEPLTVSKLDGLKLTLKFNRFKATSPPMLDQASSHQRDTEDSSCGIPVKLLCSIRLPKRKIEELNWKRTGKIEDEDDDDDECLNLY